MFTVDKLSKTIKQKQILKDVSFSLPRGQIGVFLGGSGVGKSTLFRVLNHLETHDTGQVTLDGHRLNLSTVSKEHTIGMVFQHFNLFDHLSVEKNITLPLIKLQNKKRLEAKQIALQLLDQYGLFDKAQSSIHALSGGQKQRLAIARTLALKPQIVCLDEPTSALDPHLTDQVARYIQEIAQSGCIVLVSTHDLQLVNKLDAHIFLMHSGTIIESALKSAYEANFGDYPHLNNYLSM